MDAIHHKVARHMDVTARGLVVLMTKLPFLGEVKTRLALESCKAWAADVSWAMTLDTLDQIPQSDVYDRWMALSHPVSFLKSFQGWDICDQGLGNLGDRMNRLAARAHGQYPWMVFVGSDGPHIAKQAVFETVRYLAEGANHVIGPTQDGGYYVHGMKPIHEEIFSNIHWSTSHTFADLNRNIKSQGFQPVVLQEHVDIDTLADLKHLSQASYLTHTHKVISRWMKH